MKRQITILLLLVLCLFTACTGASAQKGQDDVMEEVHSESVSTEVEEKRAPKLELSGNKEDVYTIEEDSYVEGTQAFIFLQKGISVRGDLLNVVETIMTDVSEASNLTFEKKHNHDKNVNYCDQYFEKGVFDGINKDYEKINILIVKLEGDNIQYADYDQTVLDESDFDFSFDSCQTAYHELAHVLHSRNGVFMSEVLNEGFASYVTDKCLRKKNLPAWVSFPIYMPVEFDESMIAQGEQGFGIETDDSHDNYVYGLRLLHFLEENYGLEGFNSILREATEKKFDKSYDPNNEVESKEEDRKQMIQIVRDAISQDVFEKFAVWYETKWETVVDDYLTDMENSTGETLR